MGDSLLLKRAIVVILVVSLASLACVLTPDWAKIGQSVGGTAEVLSTQAYGAIEGTVVAYVDEVGPVIEETLAAIPPGVKIGEGPGDIPVVPDTYGFYGDEDQVVFMTTLSLEDAVYFYKEMMPSHDWKEAIPSVALKKVAYLSYEKENRKALVIMTISGDKVAVRITVSEK